MQVLREKILRELRSARILVILVGDFMRIKVYGFTQLNRKLKFQKYCFYLKKQNKQTVIEFQLVTLSVLFSHQRQP